MSKRLARISVMAALTVSLGACSSSKPKEGEMADIIPASTDAGTDIVPGATPEGQIPQVPAAPEANNAIPSAPNEIPGTPPADPALTPPQQPEGVPPTPAKAPKRRRSGVIRPPANLGPLAPGEYSVQQGDTLMKIAYETYGDLYRWRSIYEANKDRISDPNRIPPGTVLKVEKPVTPVVLERNGERYEIRSGDTLGKISRNVYGTPSKWRSIWENNKQLIHDPNKIFAGFSLYYIPQSGGMHGPTAGPVPAAGGGVPGPVLQGPAPASVDPGAAKAK